uniref:EKC/KEOPS complex subunit cgi121 n=1 Tax=Rhodosorus marinus TaxID=101924 RepID=A0A7S2ZM85_9RHOD|mmetsp:Transcript_24151/g.95125  ORF Transcript_24151/g.95125 Transcript_24151/m.95125 type:complete len:148 (+) Transcript_24151:433-876(+)
MACYCAFTFVLKDVKNSLSIKSKLMSGELECAVLDKHLVVDVFQVMVAAQMAYQRYTTGKAACRTMHAEVLYSLSAMKSISNVFATFGLDGNQRELLIVVINPQKTNIEKIQSSIDGKEVWMLGPHFRPVHRLRRRSVLSITLFDRK